MNILELASIELVRENKDVNNAILLLNRAKKIRKWLDKHGKNTAQKIMTGAKVYKYGNIIKTY